MKGTSFSPCVAFIFTRAVAISWQPFDNMAFVCMKEATCSELGLAIADAGEEIPNRDARAIAAHFDSQCRRCEPRKT